MANYKVIGKGQNGKYTDEWARKDVITYCERLDKTPHNYKGSRAVNIENAAEEMNILAQVYNNDEKVRLRHSVISFDKDENIAATQADEIARAAIQYFGDEYQIIYCVHEDTDNIHVHIVMNQVSYLDGHKYHGSKKQHYDFIKYMKQVVRPYGINFMAVSDD